jgi:pimeloyl-ACP methyl ester carboxylesterase
MKVDLMEPIYTTLNNKKYRYSFYENINTDQYGILLMGTLQDIESVAYLSKEFSKSLNLFVVEVPGTGLTDPLSAVYSMQDQANMLLDFVCHMGISSAHVFAISYSTPIALEFCVMWPHAKSLSMYGGMAGIPESSRPDSMSILSDALHDRKKFAENFIKGMTVINSDIPRGKIIARSARQKILKNSQKQIDCFCENTIRLLSYSPSKKISKLLLPCVLIIGRQDPYVTVKKAEELAFILPNCVFEIIENADHLAHLEYPDLVASLMSSLSMKSVSDERHKMCVGA